MQLRSTIDMAVALAGGCSSDLTPLQATSTCYMCSPKKKKKKKMKSPVKKIGLNLKTFINSLRQFKIIFLNLI